MTIKYTVELLDIKTGEKHVFNKVTSDGIITDQSRALPYRFLLTDDGSRIEFPMERFIVSFDAGRIKVLEAAELQRRGAQPVTEPQTSVN